MNESGFNVNDNRILLFSRPYKRSRYCYTVASVVVCRLSV